MVRSVQSLIRDNHERPYVTTHSSDEFSELRQKVLERQQKMELLGNQSELMEKDSRNLHQTTNKLAEKVLQPNL